MAHWLMRENMPQFLELADFHPFEYHNELCVYYLLYPQNFID